MLTVTFVLLEESNNTLNFVLIVSNEILTSVEKSLFTTRLESSPEEICANLRFRTFKIAAIAGSK